MNSICFENLCIFDITGIMKVLHRIPFFFLFFWAALSAEPLKVKVAAKSAILINADTGAILYEKNAHAKKYPGSTTKIATLLYALKKYDGDLDEIVSCPYHCLKRINSSVKVAHNYRDPSYWLEPDGTHFWIKRGEKLSMRDLLHGMMLVSGNDASNYVAHRVGGTIPAFLRGMNGYFKSIGCRSTHFQNPHGLHHPKHVTTAHDLSLITKEALKNSAAQKIISTKEYERSETNLQNARTIKHTGQMLQPGKFYYSKSIGMKTGYHSNANYTFAGAARQGERTLIAILLDCENSNQRYRDAIRLFEAGFAQVEEERLLFKKDENFFTREIKRGKNALRASLLEDVSIRYFPAEEPNISIELNWEALELPIFEGTWVGEMHILDENQRILEKAPLYASRDVKKKSFFAFVDGLKMGSLDFTPLRNVLITFLLIAVSLITYSIFYFGKTNKL